MDESENYPPRVMTTQAMSSDSDHVLIKHEDPRSHSPTEVYKPADTHLQEMSPAATSHSSSSDLDPASPDHEYHSHSYQDGSMGPPPVPSSSYIPNMSDAATRGWGGAVPQVITTQDPNAPHYPNNNNNNNKAPTKQKTVVTVKKRYTKAGKGSTEKQSKGDTVTARRQKRLERNRESARLSRRRRKHYLEVLEDRVTDLSVEVDQGRREHASKAVYTVLEKRRAVLQTESPTDSDLIKLGKSLNRTSQELLVVSTFQTQQLKSFALAPHIKFVLWLTLQGDTYFRGGRAASERLSAARIGERMLQNGNDTVGPAHSMWPLFCNEIGLSYDQEERARNYQRAVLQEPHTWLDRHTARASGLAMQSLHDAFNSVAVRVRQREHGMSNGLTATQKVKFLAWADKNSDRLKARMEKKKQHNPRAKVAEKFELSKDHHLAANLYILNSRLQKTLNSLPKQMTLVGPASLKRLSRRPSFESLGQQREEGERRELARDQSFCSSGSLKRSNSVLSMDDSDKPAPQQVSPEDGQEAAIATVEEALGFIKEIIPPPQALIPQPMTVRISSPTPITSAPIYHHYAPAPSAPLPPVTTSQYPVVTRVNSHPGAMPESHQQSPRADIVHYHHGQQQQQYVPPPPPPTQQYYQQYQYPVASPPPQQPTYHVQYQAPSEQQQQQQPLLYQAQHQVPPVQQPLLYQAQHQVPPVQQQPVYQAQHQAPPEQLHQPVYQAQHQAPPEQLHQPVYQAQHQAPPEQQQMRPPPPQQPPTHNRRNSFLPPHLNVVPEEMFPAGDGAEDFFMSLIEDEDWAIGGGVDMDTAA